MCKVGLQGHHRRRTEGKSLHQLWFPRPVKTLLLGLMEDFAADPRLHNVNAVLCDEVIMLVAINMDEFSGLCFKDVAVPVLGTQTE